MLFSTYIVELQNMSCFFFICLETNKTTHHDGNTWEVECTHTVVFLLVIREELIFPSPPTDGIESGSQ